MPGRANGNKKGRIRGNKDGEKTQGRRLGLRGAVKPKGSKKMLIIILAAVVSLAAIGGGAAYFLMKHDAGEEGEDGEIATEKAKQDKKKAGKEVMPVYVALDAFTVNLTPENGEQYLQLILSLEVTDLKTGDKLKACHPSCATRS